MQQIDPNLLCPHCMSEKPSATAVCPACGFDPLRMECSPRCLRPMSILHGKYLLGAVLGEGGFGITYIAWDLEQQRKLAIKEYFPSTLAVRDTTVGMNNSVHSISGDKHIHYLNGLKKFEEEAKNLMRLKEVPGIVEILDFFFENSTAYIVMDFLDGVTLRTYMEKDGGCLSEKQTLQLLHPVMQSLVKVHEAGMIHRDISPDNIMVLRSGEMKLIDFGAARLSTGEETQSLSIILKHGYAPEEQYRSRGRQGPYTDVYALCAVMYKLLTGVTPIDAMARVMEDELPSLRSYPNRISARTIAAVEKGMAVRAGNRFATMQELIDALYSDAGSDDEAEEESGHTRKHWLWIGGLGAALLAVLALVLWTPKPAANALDAAMQDTPTTAEVQEDTSPQEPETEQEEESAQLPEETQETDAADTDIDPSMVHMTLAEANKAGLLVDCRPDHAEIHGTQGEVDVIRIPEYVNDVPVTVIQKEAFFQCEGLQYLSLPETLKQIDEGAFYGCLSLHELELPDGLEQIGAFAFFGCSGLKALTIPASVSGIGESAFYGCLALEELQLQEGLSEIGENAFSYCPFIKEVVLPVSLTKIGGGAFTGCDRLTFYYTPGSYAESYVLESDLPSQTVS